MKPGTRNRFCVMTTGRAGSTALMDAIAADRGVAVPARQVECRDHELLHPRHAALYAREYTRLSGSPVTGEIQLIDAFFHVNRQSTFAGFKSMPNRHRHLDSFLARTDIRIIVLLREDVVATAASFLLAMTRNTWRRAGGVPEQRITFTPEHSRTVLGNLSYVHASRRRLQQVTDAIQLSYEALCDPDFENPELDRYFGRPIRLSNPKPPTRANSYVTNHEAFAEFVNHAWKKLARQAT